MSDQKRICIGCMRERRNPVGACELCGFYPAVYIPDDNALPPGTVLQNRYELGRVLGVGENGFTYIARDRKQGTVVVINELFLHDQMRRTGLTWIPLCGAHEEEKLRWETMYDAFRRDAKQMIRLAGTDGLVRGLDSFEENETTYFVMEDLSGGTLREYIGKRGKALTFAEAMQILQPAIHALTALHTQNIAHRQITPDNLMFDGNGKLLLMEYGHLDSGVTHGLGMSAKLDREAYESPEQAAGMQSGPQEDVYSLAAVIYYCVTGRAPADAKARREGIGHLIPPRTEGAIITTGEEKALLKGMELVPKNRYQTINEFCKALEKAEREAPRQAAPKRETPRQPERPAETTKIEVVAASGPTERPAQQPKSVAAKARMQAEPKRPTKPAPAAAPRMTVAQAKKNAQEVQSKKKKLPVWVLIIIGLWVIFAIIGAYREDTDSYSSYTSREVSGQADPDEDPEMQDGIGNWEDVCWYLAQIPCFEENALADLTTEELLELLNPEGYEVVSDTENYSYQTYAISNARGTTSVNLFISDRDRSRYHAMHYARPDKTAILPDHLEGLTECETFEEFCEMCGITDEMLDWLKEYGADEQNTSTEYWTYESEDGGLKVRYMEDTGSGKWCGLECSISEGDDSEFNITYSEYGISSVSIRDSRYW